MMMTLSEKKREIISRKEGKAAITRQHLVCQKPLRGMTDDICTKKQTTNPSPSCSECPSKDKTGNKVTHKLPVEKRHGHE